MSQVPSLAELFNERFPAALAAHPAQAREVDAIFCFNITGEGGGQWTVDLKADPPVCIEGDNGSAQLTISVAAEDFKAMLSDGQAGMRLYLEDKLRLDGDPSLATRLPSFFDSVRG
jgi:hypothetical protein